MAEDMEGKNVDSYHRGQASVETMMIFAAVLIMILAVGLVLPGTTSGGENLRQTLLARQTVQQVASTADEVFLAGEGASKTIWVELPSGYDGATSFIGNRSAITIGTDWKTLKLVDIYMLNNGDTFAVSRAPMCGTWPSAYGRYQVDVTYNGTTTPHVTVNAQC